MPLLVTDFPPYARPTPPREDMAHGKRYLTSQAEDPDLKRYLRKLERALVLMLFLKETRPSCAQPLFDGATSYPGSDGRAWWHEVVVAHGWDEAVFSDAIWKLRGGGFIGWMKSWPAPVGLTRKGMREALLLRREGIQPWAPPRKIARLPFGVVADLSGQHPFFAKNRSGTPHGAVFHFDKHGNVL